MHFTDLKFPKITSNMLDRDKIAAITERRQWLNSCEEKLSTYQIAVLHSCLNYAENAFTKWIGGAVKERYTTFDNIFNITFNTVGKDDQFFDRIELEMRTIKDPTSEMLRLVLGECRHQKRGYIYTLEKNPNSDISKAISGLSETIMSFGICTAAASWANGNSYLAVALGVSTLLSELYLHKREASYLPSAAAEIVYNSDYIREKMLTASQYVPSNLWARTLTLFGRGANATLGVAENVVVRIERNVAQQVITDTPGARR